MRDTEQIGELLKSESIKWDKEHWHDNMWIYEQETGNLIHGGKIIGTGYAGGNEGKNPEGINNPLMQDKVKIGPIPRGFYVFGEVIMNSHLGQFAIPLLPDSENEMFGRSGFYMHGDKINQIYRSASEGCIIMPRPIREQCNASTDRILKVITST